MAPWPTPLGLAGTAFDEVNTASSTKKGIWNFFYAGVWTYSQLMFEFAYTDGTGRHVAEKIAASPQYSNVGTTHQSETPAWREVNYGGAWHHVAVTIEEYESEGETHTRATTYFDYAKRAERDVVGSLATTGKSGLMMQLSSSSNNRLCNWDVDEVRITGEVLDPSQFCRKSSGGGFKLQID